MYVYLEDVDGGVEQRRQGALADVHVRLDRQVLVPHLDLRKVDANPAAVTISKHRQIPGNLSLCCTAAE